ncbi:hypothetical protein L1N85_08210 [Paenibacillus alkaliterrae]|nr:hypothetical protein [Paenibacillus alkaliterrae]MCF2938417.1 hypothetical protein [Paenibacillus alkaliterrae]
MRPTSRCFIRYRMTGSFGQAEDLVQEVFADFIRLEALEIHNEKGTG